MSSTQSCVATMARPGRSVRGKALAIAVGAMILAPLTAVVLVEAPAAAAPVGPTLVQSAGAYGSNATEGSSVAIAATLGEPCNAGDTLVAFVTIAQQVDSAGAVAISPHGWTRLYEHAPSGHVAAYHGWFALSGCSGVSAATFTVTAPGNPDGTTGSVVLSEYAGLPSTLVVDYATNTGDGGGDTSGSLTASTPAPAGSLVLAALSLYAPSTVTSTPAGWSSAGTAGGSLPASTWWQTGGSGDPSASFTWSPAPAAWEMTMLILSAGPAGGPPNVVQEASEAFQSSASWSVVLPEGVTAGDALVATILSDADRAGAGFEASTVSGGGVTWKQVTGYGTSGEGTAEIWAGFASTGTTGATTVTAGLGASADGQMVISEVSGIAGIDTTSTPASGSGVDPTANPLTPTAGDFLVAAMAAPGATLWIHPGPLWSTFSMSTSPAYGAEWQSSVPATATAPQWTDFSSAPWVAVVAAFTTTATAPPGPGPVTGTTPSGTGSTGPADQPTSESSGYWMAGSDGSVFSFGGAPYEGSLPGLGVHASDIVALVPTSDGRGYWMIGKDGGVFAFGDAGFVGSLPGLGVHVSDVVGAVSTSDGRGYWMIGKDGGVFAFGDAGFVGSLPGLGVHASDVVAAVPTSTGKGYWMIGKDGGVFAFGDAGFVGSLPGLGVHVSDVVGAVPTSTGRGYWMVGSDGGVFAFGDAGFVGSLPGLGVHVHNVVGVVATQDDQGYWMVGSDGGVFAFGDAGFVGSLPGLSVHINNVVAFAPQ